MHFAAVLLALFLAATAVFANPAVERANLSVVSVEITTPEGRQRCAGFVYAPGRIMTAGHCTLHGTGFTVHYVDGGVSTATLVAESPEDIAILQIVRHTSRPALLGNPAELRPGDPVFSIGAPGGRGWTVTAGVVTRTGDEIQHSALIAPGSSGGPLLNSRGEIVGMNVRVGEFPFICIAISIDYAMKIAARLP